YGANLRITPKADLTDPCLDLCLLRGSGFRNYLSVFGEVLFAGRHVRRHDVVYRKTSRLVLFPAPGKMSSARQGTAPPLLPLDGEPAGRLEGDTVIEACPGAVTLLVPPRWRASKRLEAEARH